MSETNLEQFREVTPAGRLTLQNSAMLKVSLQGDQIQAKLGSMVAYQGDVRFEHKDAGQTGDGGDRESRTAASEVDRASRQVRPRAAPTVSAVTTHVRPSTRARGGAVPPRACCWRSARARCPRRLWRRRGPSLRCRPDRSGPDRGVSPPPG